MALFAAAGDPRGVRAKGDVGVAGYAASELASRPPEVVVRGLRLARTTGASSGFVSIHPQPTTSTVSSGTRFVGHGGNFWGVMSQVDIYPETGHVVVVLSNNDASGGEAVRNWTRRALAGLR